jgi:hypothetical protein
MNGVTIIGTTSTFLLNKSPRWTLRTILGIEAIITIMDTIAAKYKNATNSVLLRIGINFSLSCLKTLED